MVSSAGEELRKAERDGVRTVAVPMAREISPLRDLLPSVGIGGGDVAAATNDYELATAAMARSCWARVAAWLCRVPCSITHVLGLRCETTTGTQTKSAGDESACACACAHRVICVSESLRQKTIESVGIVDASRTQVVLASGSFVGTDPHVFAPRRTLCSASD